MPIKRVLRADRLRHITAQFSWTDQRLVREHYIERRGAQALALYLFVLSVADVQGLSFYGESSLCRALSMSVEQLAHARAMLMRVGLIAYERPLYQVLSLDPSHHTPSLPRENIHHPISSAVSHVHQHLKRKAL